MDSPILRPICKPPPFFVHSISFLLFVSEFPFIYGFVVDSSSSRKDAQNLERVGRFAFFTHQLTFDEVRSVGDVSIDDGKTAREAGFRREKEERIRN